MSFYDRVVLPRLLDFAMRGKEASRYRARVVPAARGRVLEMGIGSGLNLRFYGGDVTAVVGVDPSPEMLRLARPKAAAAPFPVELVNRAGETLPFDDAGFDSVVTTWTLCTIGEPLRALVEMRRVLKPDGELLFVEHGRSPDRGVEAWQDRLNPLWRRIGGGCNLNRRIDELVRAAGFRVARLETGYAKGPRPMAYIYEGRARRD